MISKSKSIALFSAILIAFISPVFSQITIVSSDMPSSGDTLRTSISLNPTTIDFAQTGENYVWDYRSLYPETQRLDTVKTVLQTPVFFWPSFLASANLAWHVNAETLLAGLPIDDAYQFFSNTTSSFRDFGYGLIISGIPLPLKFSSPDVLYNFPMSMGNTFESNADLEFALAGIGYISVQRERSNVVDGWGILKTPFGNFDVLRLKSTVFEIDSIYIDTLGQGTRVERNYIEYKWIGKNQDIPLLHCTLDDLLGTMVVYKDSIRDLTVGTNALVTNNVLNVFPNPSEREMYFNVCSNFHVRALIRVSNLQGTCVFETSDFILEEGCNTYQLPWQLSGQSTGIYFLEVNYNGETERQKFIIKTP